MPRDQIEALQVRKLKNLVAWAEARVPWQAARLKVAGVTSDSIESLKDLRRIPMMTRDEWMQAQLDKPPFGPLPPARGPLRPDPLAGPRQHEGLGVDRRDVVLWLLGLRRPAGRHRLLR